MLGAGGRWPALVFRAVTSARPFRRWSTRLSTPAFIRHCVIGRITVEYAHRASWAWQNITVTTPPPPGDYLDSSGGCVRQPEFTPCQRGERKNANCTLL